MAETVTPRISVPEIPTGKTDDFKVFKFVRSIFETNGCMVGVGTDLVSGEFFRYRPGDREAKHFDTTRYLPATGDKPLLIFTAHAHRHSQAAFDQSQARESMWSDGRRTLAEAGREAYEIGTVSSAEGLHSSELLLGTYYSHKYGTVTGIGASFGRGPNVSGQLVREALYELGLEPTGQETDSDRIQKNALIIGKLVELL